MISRAGRQEIDLELYRKNSRVRSHQAECRISACAVGDLCDRESGDESRLRQARRVRARHPALP
jgi:hypothetical protein